MKVLSTIALIHFAVLLVPIVQTTTADQIFTSGGAERLQVTLISTKGSTMTAIKKRKDIGTHQEQSSWDLHHPAPIYPKVAVQKGWEGEVVLTISSDEFGIVKKTDILESSGFNLLDSAALNAVSKWKTIANLNHQKVPIVFKLKKRL